MVSQAVACYFAGDAGIDGRTHTRGIMSRTTWLHSLPIPGGGITTLLAALLLLPPSGAAYAQAPLPIEQLPLSGGVKSGASVTPIYEGWYANPDGDSNTIYFGYYNRNSEEEVEVPVGPNNRIEGLSEGGDEGQPTRFQPGRHWGVFGVRVPADFDGSVVWHLSMRGQTFDIPGELREDWSAPAISGDAIGNRPPSVSFQPDGPVGAGPGGIWDPEVRSARVDETVPLDVLARDDGVAGEVGAPVVPGPLRLTWLLHRGPADVVFTEASGGVPVSGGDFKTYVIFPEPGEYVLRVRVNDWSGLAPAGYEQCCWTNGFVRYTVTP